MQASRICQAREDTGRSLMRRLHCHSRRHSRALLCRYLALLILAALHVLLLLQLAVLELALHSSIRFSDASGGVVFTACP